MSAAADPRSARTSVDEPPDLGLLFHRLNNQLGIILANAELLEAKATDEMTPRPRVAGRGERPRRDGHRQGNSEPIEADLAPNI